MHGDNWEDNTGLFISPSGISELDCATTKTDTAERSISIGRESIQVFFELGALAYFQVPPLGGSREEKWNLSKFFFVLGALAYFQVPSLGGSREEKWRSQ